MDEGNEYNLLMGLKHADGRPMFNNFSITLMCEACRKAGALTCPHTEHEVRAPARPPPLQNPKA